MRHLMRLTTASVCLAAIAGCSNSRSISIEQGSFEGPEMRFGETERTHTAIFTMPSGGWALQFDRSREQYDLREVFVTLRRPAPGVYVTLALVEQAVETGVKLTENIDLYARVLDSSDSRENRAYRFVGRASKR